MLLRSAGVASFALMSAAMKWAGEAGAVTLELVFFRSLIGVPVLLAWLAMGDGIGTIRTRRPFAHLWRSILSVISLAMLYQALILLPMADAVTIGFSAPAFATLFSALLLGESVGRFRWAAVALGFVGVAIVAGPGGETLPVAGIACALIGALANAGATVLIREMGARETPGAIVFWFFICALLVGGIGMIFVAQPHPPLVWGLMLFGGIIGTAAQMFMTLSLQRAPVSAVVPLDYVQIIWAALLGWLIWATVPGLSTFLGAGLIAFSGLFTAWREHRLRRDSVAAAVAAVD